MVFEKKFFYLVNLPLLCFVNNLTVQFVNNLTVQFVNIINLLLCVFLVLTGGNIHVLDLAAKIDQCAEYICKQKWGEIEFPPPFGREAYPAVSCQFWKRNKWWFWACAQSY